MKTQEERNLGEMIRETRITKGLGLRETARHLEVSAAYLTDIEKNRRTPSDARLQELAIWLELDIAELRSLAGRFDDVVKQIAVQDKVTADKVPTFLRAARRLTAEEWDQLIQKANTLSGKKGKQ